MTLPGSAPFGPSVAFLRERDSRVEVGSRWRLFLSRVRRPFDFLISSVDAVHEIESCEPAGPFF